MPHGMPCLFATSTKTCGYAVLFLWERLPSRDDRGWKPSHKKNFLADKVAPRAMACFQGSRS